MSDDWPKLIPLSIPVIAWVAACVAIYRSNHE